MHNVICATINQSRKWQYQIPERKVNFMFYICCLWNNDTAQLQAVSGIFSLNFHNFRSLCPWHYYMTKDINRYPEDILEAECACDECIGIDGYRCEKLKYFIPVLRRNLSASCHQGYYQYDLNWYGVSVGCVCGRPTLM